MGRLGLLLVLTLIIIVTVHLHNISDIMVMNSEEISNYTYEVDDNFSAEEVIDKLVRHYIMTATHDTTINYGDKLGIISVIANANHDDIDTLQFTALSFEHKENIDTQRVSVMVIVDETGYNLPATSPMSFITKGSSINNNLVDHHIDGKSLPGVTLPDDITADAFVAGLDKKDKIDGTSDSSYIHPDYSLSTNAYYTYYDILDLYQNILKPNATINISAGSSFGNSDLWADEINCIEGDLTDSRLTSGINGSGILVVDGRIDISSENIVWKGLIISILPEDASGSYDYQFGKTSSVSGSILIASPKDTDLNLNGDLSVTYFKNHLEDAQSLINNASSTGSSSRGKIVSLEYYYN